MSERALSDAECAGLAQGWSWWRETGDPEAFYDVLDDAASRLAADRLDAALADPSQSVAQALVNLGKRSYDAGDMHEYRHALAALNAGNSDACTNGHCRLDAAPTDPGTATTGSETASREALTELLTPHRPVVNQQGWPVGCQCMDRVFVRDVEDYPSHLADVMGTGLVATILDLWRVDMKPSTEPGTRRVEVVVYDEEPGPEVTEVEALGAPLGHANKLQRVAGGWWWAGNRHVTENIPFEAFGAFGPIVPVGWRARLRTPGTEEGASDG